MMIRLQYDTDNWATPHTITTCWHEYRNRHSAKDLAQIREGTIFISECFIKAAPWGVV